MLFATINKVQHASRMQSDHYIKTRSYLLIRKILCSSRRIHDSGYKIRLYACGDSLCTKNDKYHFQKGIENKHPLENLIEGMPYKPFSINAYNNGYTHAINFAIGMPVYLAVRDGLHGLYYDKASWSEKVTKEMMLANNIGFELYNKFTVNKTILHNSPFKDLINSEWDQIIKQKSISTQVLW